jgi:hypothetical protein
MVRVNRSSGWLGHVPSFTFERRYAAKLEFGAAKELNASDTKALLAGLPPQTPAGQVRHQLALELLDEVRALDSQLKASLPQAERRRFRDDQTSKPYSRLTFAYKIFCLSASDTLDRILDVTSLERGKVDSVCG